MTTKSYTYSDLNLNLGVHPGTLDITKYYDFEAVKNAVRSVLKSNSGDRPFNRSFGANLRRILFEPMSPEFALVIREQLIQTISIWEPRVIVEDVLVEDNSTLNEITITLLVVLKDNPEVQGTITETLTRVR